MATHLDPASPSSPTGGGFTDTVDTVTSKGDSTMRGMAARDSSWIEKLDLSSVELRAARLAGAVHRLRMSGFLDQIDRRIVQGVSDDLAGEANILRGTTVPSVGDETVLALAGAALFSMRSATPSPPAEAPRLLDQVADQLRSLLREEPPGDEELAWIEGLFERTSQNVAGALGEIGERVQDATPTSWSTDDEIMTG